MRHGRTGSEGHDRVLAVLQENAASLLKLARRHSLCDDDAQDAYQRGLEIYLHRLDSVDPATAGSWLRTVVKHEAMAIREQRLRTLGVEEVDLDELVAPELSSGEERAIAFDRVTRAAEALQRCKRDEIAALMLNADGHSYDEICAVTGWTYTKVNRCLTEGRRRFLARYAAIEAGAECERLAPLLSMIVDGEATPVQMAEARPHLRNCPACRAYLREMAESQTAIAAVLPASLLLGGGVVPDETAGIFARAYELLAGGLHDRVVLTAIKGQQVVEAASATKVAAVAASAAAIAGGGAAAVDRAREAERTVPRAQVAKRPKVDRPAPATASRVVALAPRPRAERRRPARPSTARAATATPTPTPAPRQEFGFEARAAAPAAEQPQPDPAARPVRTEDFGFER